MSLGTRDAEAFALANRRIFDDGAFDERALVAVDLDMQTRRLALTLYGRSRSDGRYYLTVGTFFNAGSLTIDGEDAFPQSALVARATLAYDGEDDIAKAFITGARSWTLGFSFEGMSLDERPATLSSFADDDDA